MRLPSVVSSGFPYLRPAGPLTPKGRERRSDILRAAREVFEERGFLDTRVSDIVAAAGVAQGTFYSYFDSKEAVFTEVAQQVVATMKDCTPSSSGTSTRWSGSGGPWSGSSRRSGPTPS